MLQKAEETLETGRGSRCWSKSLFSQKSVHCLCKDLCQRLKAETIGFQSNERPATPPSSRTFGFKREPKIKFHLRNKVWAVSSCCLMMPFVCFLGTSLSNLLDSAKAWRGVVPHKTSWFLILSADNQIDHRLLLHLLPSTLPCTPKEIGPRCPSCSPITPFRNRLFQEENGELGGQGLLSVSQRRVFGEKEKTEKTLKFPRILTHLIEISCPIFSEIRKLALFYREQYFPKERDEGKCFQLLFGFCCFNHIEASSVSIKVPFLLSRQSDCWWCGLSGREGTIYLNKCFVYFVKIMHIFVMVSA